MQPAPHSTDTSDNLMSDRAPDRSEISEILSKARELAGLSEAEVSRLLRVRDPADLEMIFAAARGVKEAIYGKRLVLFAPLYISNLCRNACLYCAFNARNSDIKRRRLTLDEVREETRALLRTGHKRLLLVSGETGAPSELSYICEAIDAIYDADAGASIRRVNVNVAPLDIDDLRVLKGHRIGTYQVFQETYHRPTYARMHVAGPKVDFDYRLGALERAMAAGIDDVGMGALFGLYDYRFEVAAIMRHAARLEGRFGAGPHTISVPRLEPAEGSAVAARPPHPVSDRDFLKTIAALRLAVPYTGIILSTRESAAIRTQALELGVSQISAGSRTQPGGYGAREAAAAPQFQLGDHRSLDEVVADVLASGHLPSFCTGCYRRGRTGADFMDLAKPGLIKQFCLPNALLTLKEYLEDHGSAESRELGIRIIARQLQEIPSAHRREETARRLEAVARGDRDLYF